MLQLAEKHTWVDCCFHSSLASSWSKGAIISLLLLWVEGTTMLLSIICSNRGRTMLLTLSWTAHSQSG